VNDAEFKQTGQGSTVMQAGVATVKAAPNYEPEPLTEEEAISVVQSWVEQDAEVELSERRAFEEMVSDLQDAAEYRGSNIAVSRFKEIVKQHAPNAPHTPPDVPHTVQPKTPPYPPELTPLIESGVAVLEGNYWHVKRCTKCGQFKTSCCGEIKTEIAVTDDGTFTFRGRQAIGREPIKPPKPPKTSEEIKQEQIVNLLKSPWWVQFRSTGELEGSGQVKMYINNILPEGITLICGLPKEGKSWLALSIAKALTSGKPLAGNPEFSVPEMVPVLYLAAESGDGALKLRCDKMGITNDKTKFMARTLSQGPMFGLDDDNIRNAVQAIRPIVVLETLIRFNSGENEDSSTENRKLADSLFRLVAWGARAVVAIHHSRKDLDKRKPTKEAAVRGSGDGLAMVDAVWLVMQDERLYQGGKGPNEVDIVGWGRDFNPAPMRLALTGKALKDQPGTAGFASGIVSHIDSKGDLAWVDKRIVFGQEQSTDQMVEQLVIENPSISKKMLTERTKLSEWDIRNALKRLGYRREKGGKKGASDWIKVQS
jgi:AAA domain